MVTIQNLRLCWIRGTTGARNHYGLDATYSVGRRDYRARYVHTVYPMLAGKDWLPHRMPTDWHLRKVAEDGTFTGPAPMAHFCPLMVALADKVREECPGIRESVGAYPDAER